MDVLLKQINKKLSLTTASSLQFPVNLPFGKGQELRKLKASTLIEVLVASVLIIIVFTIASLTLNNVFKSTIKSNTHSIDTHLNKLLYLYQYDKISIKHQEDFKDWSVTFSQQVENNVKFIVIEAIQTNTKKTISKRVIDEGIR
jgi:hypothetical protein